MYDFFKEALETKSHFLVRICVNRRTEKRSNVYEQMKKHPTAGRHKIKFFDESGKLIETELDIKFKNVVLKPSDGQKAKRYGNKSVSVIFAKEVAGRTKGIPLIDWKLVTDLVVSCSLFGSAARQSSHMVRNEKAYGNKYWCGSEVQFCG